MSKSQQRATVFGEEGEWMTEEDSYSQQLVDTEQIDKEQKSSQSSAKGLGKNIKQWKQTRGNPYGKNVHPTEQRPILQQLTFKRDNQKWTPYPSDREFLRRPLKDGRHVILKTFRVV